MSGISCKWITCGAPAPFYARKKFCISKQVKKAHAKVCGLGQFIFYVNGKKAGDHELDPGWTNYRKLIQYVVFDVTDDLVQGENVIGAEVGNGWFIKTDEHYTFSLPEFMPPNPNPYQPYGKSLVLGLELTITYMDGAEETIHTDETFAVKEHPVVMSNVYGSETIDGSTRMKRRIYKRKKRVSPFHVHSLTTSRMISLRSTSVKSSSPRIIRMISETFFSSETVSFCS